MDNKYQDLYIQRLNNRSLNDSLPIVFRQLEIRQIVFLENEIHIDFIKGATPMTMIIPKKNNSITID